MQGTESGKQLTDFLTRIGSGCGSLLAAGNVVAIRVLGTILGSGSAAKEFLLGFNSAVIR